MEAFTFWKAMVHPQRGTYLKMMSHTRNGTDIRNSQRCLQKIVLRFLGLAAIEEPACLAILPPFRSPRKPETPDFPALADPPALFLPFVCFSILMPDFLTGFGSVL